MTVWPETKFGFPYPEKLESLDWDNKEQEFIPKVLNTKNVDDYYLVLMEFARLLDNSHTAVLPPWGYFEPGYDMPPIEVIVIDDRFIISRVGDNDEIKTNRIIPGIEILQVEGTPVRKYFDENVLKYYTQGSKHASDAMLTVYLLNGPNDKKVELTIKDVGGTIKSIELSRNSTNDDGSPFMYQFVHNIFVENSITVNELENDNIYVKIPNFENDEIGDTFQELIDRIDVSRINGMIIDIRNNMGGSSRVCDKIVECLIDEPITSPLMKYPFYSAANKAWCNDEKWDVSENTIYPRRGKRYLGPIVVLINSITNSTAEDFAIELRYGDRAKIVGQVTSGGAGNTLEIPLPVSGIFKLATFKAILPDESDYMGIRIKPDVDIDLNIEDITENIDRTLEAGIRILKK